MNVKLAGKVLRALLERGVREFCICAGARNAPLVLTLEAADNIKIYSFVDERSASFFALGRIQATGSPVAVVMTSGTAVAECLPAVIEAYYQSLPLVIVSADRPRAYRGTGAPQAIEQFGLFALYTPMRSDIEHESDELDLPNGPMNAPAQVNVCFDEPLMDGPVEKISFDPGFVKPTAAPPLSWTQGISLDRPLVIVGALTPEERPAVEDFLLRARAPVWLESLSGLRDSALLEPFAIKSGDPLVRAGLREGWFKSVLRLGGVPTTRLWRDLEGEFELIPVFSVTHGDFAGLSRASRHFSGFHHLDLLQIKESAPTEQVRLVDEDHWARIETLLEKFPRSEVGMLWTLRKRFAGGRLYVGNSLPIREWDLIGWGSGCRDILANRGANGIDGQISTFLGWTAQGDDPAWAVIGDLTTIYDLNAPAVLGQLGPCPRNLVIINNHGGQIFRMVSKSPLMLLPHATKFEPWAQMWGATYECWREVPEAPKNQSPFNVIELLPDEEETQKFNQEYKLL